MIHSQIRIPTNKHNACVILLKTNSSADVLDRYVSMIMFWYSGVLP